MTTIPAPTIGRVVLYRTDGRNGLVYDLPAIVTCTIFTHPGDYPTGSSNPLPIPRDRAHVHLTVLTPGGFGTKLANVWDGDGPDVMREPESDQDFVGAPKLQPGSGSYVEWNVPPADPADPAPRTWRWPERNDSTVEVPA